MISGRFRSRRGSPIRKAIKASEPLKNLDITVRARFISRKCITRRASPPVASYTQLAALRRGVCGSRQTHPSPFANNPVVKNSPVSRLKAVEDHFAHIERLIKELRKRFADLAEEVRIAADQLGGVAPQNPPIKRPSVKPR